MQVVERIVNRSGRFLPDLVIKNTVAGYGVQMGRKLIPLASMPYLARVLGPEGWGEVAFITAMAELVAIVIEFGFGLSATRSVARYRDDAVARGKITTGVLGAQVLLAAGAVAAVLIAAQFVPFLKEHPRLVTWGIIYSLAEGFTPFWYFQGTERIRLSAALEMGSKFSALGALFLLVKGPQHVWRALAIQALTPSVMAFVGIPLAFWTSVPCRPRWSVIHAVLGEGWDMFVYRSTESLYGVANAFLLGLYASPTDVGYFSAAEKVSKATAGLVNPIREALYPRINHLMHRDKPEAARLAKIGSVLIVVLGLLLSIALFTFAGTAIKILMGGQFKPAVDVLKILSPLPILLAVTISSGQFWLLPMRKDRVILRVVFRAAVVNLTLSFLLSPKWGHIGMAMAVLCSESVVSSCLLWNVMRLRRDIFCGSFFTSQEIQ